MNKQIIQKKFQSIVKNNELYELMEELFPICRSITGDGVRDTLKILKKKIKLKIIEIPTGTKVFDWKIPLEWNIHDAYVKDSKGNRIIDFKKSNIHILNYSIAINKKISKEELKKHLHTLPEKPNSIPYVTSYYKKQWGFCTTHNHLKSIKDNFYDVKIDSTLKKGSLTYGEFLIKGKISDEILISTYVCHPSLCNDNLSGIVISAKIAEILSKTKTYFSYRFIFIPETIGAIAWISKNENSLSKVKNCLVITCAGDDGKFTYKKTKFGNATIDEIVTDVFKKSTKNIKIKKFFPYGSDERQFSSPGINIPTGVFMRTQYYEFEQYHTADDNLQFVKNSALNESLSMVLEIISEFELRKQIKEKVNKKRVSKSEDVFMNINPKCEPQLGKRKIYRETAKRRLVGKMKSQDLSEMAIFWILNFSDGNHSLNDICKKSGLSINLLKKTSKILIEKKLLKKLI
jgi:aminopeptidase-like protein